MKRRCNWSNYVWAQNLEVINHTFHLGFQFILQTHRKVSKFVSPNEECMLHQTHLRTNISVKLTAVCQISSFWSQLSHYLVGCDPAIDSKTNVCVFTVYVCCIKLTKLEFHIKNHLAIKFLWQKYEATAIKKERRSLE